ncbi:Piso0_005015 [Millerozyma farinosa CBS 7064]|uniref:Piso0_005015 protein n=1 Tax=Pichia sorbitophila (strain ATCC MYA-4447 / BCRC 22081 / CBS 7064 / NBRC 10061 / NRRL Y-12695) TaxID=559304 RepID=G8Y401_PICSO|nr:Piso0_005015 [Millerozyma farinosa CBS 7064]
MDLADPLISQQVVDQSESSDKGKVDEAATKLEDEIDKTYEQIEGKITDLWKNASANAGALQEKYKLNKQRQHLMESLDAAKANINNGANWKEQLGHIENEIHDLNTKANTMLDSLDEKLEVVEKQAGKYVNQFTSFLSGIVSVSPDNQAPSSADRGDSETIFAVPLNAAEKYGTSRFENELYKLHTSPGVFTDEKRDDSKELEEFNPDLKTDEISSLLSKYSDTLEKLMNNLVPVKVSYKTFWFRYFKKEKELKDAENKRKKLLSVKNKDPQDDSESENDKFDWDDDENEQDVAKRANDLAKGKQSKKANDDPSSTTENTELPGNGNDDDDDDDWE